MRTQTISFLLVFLASLPAAAIGTICSFVLGFNLPEEILWPLILIWASIFASVIASLVADLVRYSDNEETHFWLVLASSILVGIAAAVVTQVLRLEPIMLIPLSDTMRLVYILTSLGLVVSGLAWRFRRPGRGSGRARQVTAAFGIAIGFLAIGIAAAGFAD